MDIIMYVASVIQVISVSLGMGSSTIAILNFFNAITDGQIDPTERRMMGTTYTVLRIAKSAIIITAVILGVFGYMEQGTAYFTNYVFAQYTLILVLVVNAILMTKRIMPSTHGPAIQAGSWYLLGLGVALVELDLTDFSYTLFLLAYAGELIFASALINFVMYRLKKNNKS
jgi:hypothetical protein